jgi:tRNA(adenine34) deaminase
MTTKKKWSAKIDTDSTHPDSGLFRKSPTVIAKALASKKVSPKGPGSGMRMLTFYINRAGKNLTPARKRALEKAKTLLSEILAEKKAKSEKNRTRTKRSTKAKVPRKSATKSAIARTKKKVAKKAA